MDAYEREEKILCDAVNSGEMTQAEFDRCMKELYEQLREEAQQAADEAYEHAMSR